jgi:phosphoribosylformylglycinamidine synthase
LANFQGIASGDRHQTWNEILLTLLDTPTIASKKWIYRQYDHQVQNNTVVCPGGADAAVIRVRDLGTKPTAATIGVAATTDCNPRYVYLDPYEGSKAAVAEAARNLSCVGSQPLAVTDNLNFGSPEKPIGYWQLALSCRGIADACRELNTPVTGGNVSLYNETVDSEGNPQPIYPTPVIGMVGLVADINKVCGQGWRKDGDLIYLLGVDRALTLGGSEYLASIHGIVAGKPPQVDFALERSVQQTCREGISRRWINSAHDCSEGGLAIALAECCLGGNLGAWIELNLSSDLRWDELLFGEAASRIIVSIKPEYLETWETYLREFLGNNWQKIGYVCAAESQLNISVGDNIAAIAVKIKDMKDSWSKAIERRLK